MPALFAGFFLGPVSGCAVIAVKNLLKLLLQDTDTAFVSGLLIDEHQQVLDVDFETIPGLFATGNCSGCRFGFQYTTSLPGQSISMAQTLGREAGRWIAAL